MTSKRNSRIYLDETMRIEEGQQMPSSSRSSSKEDTMQATKEFGEGHRNGVSIREATAIARSQTSVTAAKEYSVSGTTRSGDSVATSVSSTTTASFTGQPTEHPHAPLSGRPLNFGVVVPGVYRSSYPKPPDFEYIKSLKLRTIVSLVQKDERDFELESFVSNNGIRQIIINMKGTKKEAIPISTMKAILSIILDRKNHPLLMHCNHGKHRTGCVVAVVRKVSGWDTQSVVDEYKSYAAPKIRDCDVAYVTSFQVGDLRNLGEERMAYSPVQIRTFFRALLFSCFVMVLWLMSGLHMNSVIQQT
ncbi:hypothetical protein G7046_g789 [Stylonectria norvegica]|nr:hypothetical protein G7046_g789 [Stylonectria norvegica]